jgi:hypothetical protein
MGRNLGLIALTLLYSGCNDGPTRLLLHIDATSGLAVQTLTLDVAAGGEARDYPVPGDGRAPQLPGTVIVLLPDADADVALTLSGTLAGGGVATAQKTVHATAHAEVEATLTLGASGDLGAPGDLGCARPARCGYAFRRHVTITNADAQRALPAGLTVRVPLGTQALAQLVQSGKARADFADVRVFYDPTDVERDRVIDAAPPGQEAALFVSLAEPVAGGATAGDYWVYYGDPNAGAAPANGASVFALFDDFDGAAVGTQWLVNGAPQVAGGMVTLRKNQQDGLTTNAAFDGLPALSTLEASMRITDATSAGQLVGTDTFWYWFGYQMAGSFTTSRPWVLWIARTPNTVDAEDESQTPMCGSGVCVSANFAQDTAVHRYRIERDAAQTRFYLDGALKYTATNTNTVDFSPMLRNFAVTSDLVVDWIRGTSLASPAPTVTLGTEQQN